MTFLCFRIAPRVVTSHMAVEAATITRGLATLSALALASGFAFRTTEEDIGRSMRDVVKTCENLTDEEALARSAMRAWRDVASETLHESLRFHGLP